MSLEQKIARTHPSSNNHLSHLFPASQNVRVRRLNIKLRRFDHICTALVQTIEHSQPLRAELEEIFLEADQNPEGHGTILQEMWEADAADKLNADFMADQYSYD